MSNTSEIFAQLHSALQADPSKANGMEAVYQFNLTGEDAGTYQIVLKSDSAFASAGDDQQADCKLTMDANDFKEMIAGNLTGTSAFMSGRLTVDGDLSLALRLEQILNAYAPR